MSALSVPNLLSPQAKPPAQANNAQPEAETPFSSVLQQKVQSSKDAKGDKAAKSAEPSTASAAPENTAQAPSEPTAKAEGADQEATTTALVNGDYAQTALQQLLPWLQSLQGKAAQTETSTTVATATDTQLLPQAVDGVAQAQAALPGLQADPKLAQHKDAAANAQTDLPAAALQKDSTAAASTAANLAATVDPLTAGDKRKPGLESFDTALQGANQRIESQLPQAVATPGTTEGRGQEVNRLQAPVGSPQWQNEFTDRVQLMSRNNEGRAELVLTPPHLGRIEVTLNISGDQASAMFVSASPEVRTALEGAMDRLREALANSGISLGQTHVGAESSNQSADGGSNSARQGGALVGNLQDTGTTTTAWTRQSNNMLDVFA